MSGQFPALEKVIAACKGRESFDSSQYPYLRQLNFDADIPAPCVWWNNFTIEPDLCEWDEDMTCVVLANGLFVDAGQYHGYGTEAEPWRFRTVVVQNSRDDDGQALDDGYGWDAPIECRQTDSPEQCLRDIHELVNKWSRESPPFPKGENRFEK